MVDYQCEANMDSSFKGKNYFSTLLLILYLLSICEQPKRGGGGGEQKLIGGECLSPVAPNVNFYRLSD